MKQVFVTISLTLAAGFLTGSCSEKEDSALIRGRVICRGGCFNDSYYLEIAAGHRIGKKQTVIDINGNDRGVYQNIVIVTNLKAADQRENAEVIFRKFNDIEFSCQSSYPRFVREIEITY